MKSSPGAVQLKFTLVSVELGAFKSLTSAGAAKSHDPPPPPPQAHKAKAVADSISITLTIATHLVKAPLTFIIASSYR
jgi:hypothetical protein